MEQKDYFLREIEKIGLIISAIRQILLGGPKENLAITIDVQIQRAKELLYNRIGLDLEKFLSMEVNQSWAYLSEFDGLNIINIEKFADLLFLIGVNGPSDRQKIFLEKALFLYEKTNLESKTFSFERNSKINEIQKRLIER